ncbi:cell adhesion molecule CEACAM5-like [Pempheris klunzingeri]|uniref:cell adhesion molecule CEACAM5-like n=1 Tax=Pempheris klunzingeri TaxID=3127111 RepID=UPI003980AF04
MEIAVICFIILGVISGLTRGSGLLPDGPLNATVGEMVMFNTSLPPTEKPFVTANWKFGAKNIITANIVNITSPGYEGRITFFPSTASLELRNLALNDSGKYTIIITPQGTEEISGTTTLAVYARISDVIVTLSSTDLVEFNSSVRLSCSSSGSSPSFHWLNGSSEVTQSDRVQLTDGGANLTITNVTRYDEGQFSCQVFNPVSDDKSEPVNISISYGPENVNLTLDLPQEYYGEGSNIRLMCSAVSTPSAQFMWFLNGDLLNDTGPELRLINIQMSQSGNYSCQAFNSKTLRHETSQPAVVSVLERISGASVTSSPNQPIEGNPVNLTCNAAGSVFTREWMKDGSNLSQDFNKKTLSFKSLSKKDKGKYSCRISNPINSEVATYIMIVNYGPDNVQIKGPSEIHLKKPLTLHCSAESTPAATYTWTLNEMEIHNSPVFTKRTTELSDSGNYTCEARNDVTGRTSSVVHQLSVTGTKMVLIRDDLDLQLAP